MLQTLRSFRSLSLPFTFGEFSLNIYSQLLCVFHIPGLLPVSGQQHMFLLPVFIHYAAEFDKRFIFYLRDSQVVHAGNMAFI